ncbi:MAG: hypothetical protein ACREH8_08450 [Opitutaceae bacterium]
MKCVPVTACMLGSALFAGGLAAQSLPEKVRAYRTAHERAIIEEYLKFVAIPNVAADRAALRRNAEFILGMMAQRG